MTQGQGSKGPKKLLLADDSVVIQKLVGLSFANENVEIVYTDNGDDAVDRARSERPDVVLADVVMPGKSGYEVCEAVKRDPALAQVPVLLLTGTFEAFDEARAAAAGADGQITKPFEAQALVSRVNEVMAAAPSFDVSSPLADSGSPTVEAPSCEAASLESPAPETASFETPAFETQTPSVDPITQLARDLTPQADTAISALDVETALAGGEPDASVASLLPPEQDANARTSPDLGLTLSSDPVAPSALDALTQLEPAAPIDSDQATAVFGAEAPLIADEPIPASAGQASIRDLDLGLGTPGDPSSAEPSNPLADLIQEAAAPPPIPESPQALPESPPPIPASPQALPESPQALTESPSALPHSSPVGGTPTSALDEATQFQPPPAFDPASTAAPATRWDAPSADVSAGVPADATPGDSPLFVGESTPTLDVSESDFLDLNPSGQTGSDLDFGFDVSEQQTAPRGSMDSFDQTFSSLMDVSEARILGGAEADTDVSASSFDVSASEIAAPTPQAFPSADPVVDEAAASFAPTRAETGADELPVLPPSRPPSPPEERIPSAAPDTAASGALGAGPMSPAEPIAFAMGAAAAEETVAYVSDSASEAAATPTSASGDDPVPDVAAGSTDRPELSPMMEQRVQEVLEKVAWEAFSDLSEDIVKQVVARVEKIAWEVIPQMAETLVREEIRAMKGDDD